MTTQICARFDDLTGGGSAFELRNPTAELVARTPGEVPAVMVAAEQAAKSGAWVAGFVTYEAASAFDPVLAVRPTEEEIPLVWFGVFEERVTIPTIRTPTGGSAPWRLDWTAERHADAVADIKELLAAGETYQVNLTVRARRAIGDPFDLYAGMAHAQGGAYNGYLETSTHAVVCASPELFFEQTGTQLVTRPMKGTRARGRWPAEDAAQAEALLDSAKDRAEHVMIVDLVRNDLGRVAQPGTVTVCDLATIERYHTLWQLTSTIAAQPRSTVSLVDIFTALFPSGSVTGAPKARTMEIIAGLEGRPRGVYCGAVGYLTPSGDQLRSRFAVAIRTAAVDRTTGLAEYGTGGGITWSSDPAEEWQELRDKCAILDPPAPPPALFETLRLDRVDGPFNLEGHLDRLESSARFFAVPFHRCQAKEEVQAASARTRAADGSAVEPRQRLRMTLAGDGTLSVSLGAFPSSKPGPVRLGLAAEPVDSQDRNLFFKSTNRHRYDHARAGRPDVDDVVLYNERGEVTETTIANLAVLCDGRWWTPSLGSGLLPGVERTRLINAGTLAERPITVDELRAATEIAVVSSLRGWRHAILVDRVVEGASRGG